MKQLFEIEFKDGKSILAFGESIQAVAKSVQAVSHEIKSISQRDFVDISNQ